MIIDPHEQGSDGWLKARCGIPTASEADKIHTSTGKESSQTHAYKNGLLAEWLLGRPMENYVSSWMERGSEIEQEARDFHAFQCNVEVEQVGFCYSDERKLFGASPDGLIGDDGLLEIKCPKGSTHMGHLLAGRMPVRYSVQVQAQLLVTGRAWVDFLSYYPGLPPFLVRVERDDRYIMGLRAAVENFIERMLQARKELEAKGYTPGEQT